MSNKSYTELKHDSQDKIGKKEENAAGNVINLLNAAEDQKSAYNKKHRLNTSYTTHTRSCSWLPARQI